MEPGPLIDRDEVAGFLLKVYDLADDVAAIRRMMEEDDGGEEETA